jgi:DNA-binding LacI/PurR family transcriptional regulator
LVEEAVRVLVKSIEEKDMETKKLKIDSPLVIRNSTKKRL